jgi:hypothetical protein
MVKITVTSTKQGNAGIEQFNTSTKHEQNVSNHTTLKRRSDGSFLQNHSVVAQKRL